MDFPDELFPRVCGFVRTMSNTCRACLRPRSICADCDLRPCRDLEAALSLVRLPLASRIRHKAAPLSYRERAECYRKAIAKAAKPLTAREIDPENTVSGRGLKYWTLRRMARSGMLKTFCDGKTTYFSLPNKETKKHENNRTGA